MTEGGCEACREGWDRGERPRRLLASMERQAIVFRCDVCGTFWEMTERLAAPLAEGEVRAWGDELSQAVVRYLGWGEENYPRERPAEVERTFGAARGGLLVDDVRAVIGDVGGSVHWSSDDDAAAYRAARATITARHPELTGEAARALAWKWSWDRR